MLISAELPGGSRCAISCTPLPPSFSFPCHFVTTHTCTNLLPSASPMPRPGGHRPQKAESPTKRQSCEQAQVQALGEGREAFLEEVTPSSDQGQMGAHRRDRTGHTSDMHLDDLGQGPVPRCPRLYHTSTVHGARNPAVSVSQGNRALTRPPAWLSHWPWSCRSPRS